MQNCRFAAVARILAGYEVVKVRYLARIFYIGWVENARKEKDFYFVTNTEFPSEKVLIAYEKRGNTENYIKEAKYDMAVGQLLLQTFWAKEAIFQLMMRNYNLFLLFKMDFVNGTEYQQQIKTCRSKYIFLAGKIIRMARSVVLKLSINFPYQDI